MRIRLPQSSSINYKDFMRQAGYAAFIDPFTQKMSFTRRLTSDFYPRLHVYIEKNPDGQTYLSLHLDQKQPSYPGAHSHSAEYDGPIVEKEGQRLGLKFQERRTAAPPETNEARKGFFVFRDLWKK